MAVTLINPFEVEPEREAEFVASWMQTATVFAGERGYLDTRLHRSLDPGARFRFVNVAHWSSAQSWADAMRAFPPHEGGSPGVKGSPALYEPVSGGSIEARNASVQEELRGLEEGLARAYQANDVGFLDHLLADDYSVTDGPGTVSDKRKVLADHAGKHLRVAGFRFDEMLVLPLGPDAATVSGQYTWEATYDGHPVLPTCRYLRVYAREATGWRLRTGQVTPVLPPRA